MFFRPSRIRVSLDCGDRQITKQSHKAECDIYNILKNYQRTGIITHVQNARPTYEDLPSNVDFQSAMNTIIEAEAAFAALPAKVRDHFRNDPARFLAAFSDKDQVQALRDFGLVRPAPAPAAAAVAGADVSPDSPAPA